MLHKLWLYEKSDNLYYRCLKNPKATKAIIFLHGLGGTNVYWSDAYKKLCKDCSLYFIDALGFGYSKKPKGKYDMAMHIKALHKFIENDVDETEIVLVGHSMGANLALAYTAEYPESVKKTILMSLGYYLSKEQAKHYIFQENSLATVLDDGLAGQFACWLVCNFRPAFMMFASYIAPEFPEKIAKGALLHTHDSYFGTLRNIIYKQNIPDLIKKVGKAKLRLIHGEVDTTVPLTNIEQLEKLYDLHVEKVVNVGHDFPLFQAEKAASLVKKYI